jgi:hypothetical protein
MRDPSPVSSPRVGEVGGASAPDRGRRLQDERRRDSAGDGGAGAVATTQSERELEIWLMRWEGEGGRLAPEHSRRMISP